MKHEKIVTERPHDCIIRIWHGEDWYDALPQLVDNAGLPYDLTDVTLELFIRPTLDHSVLIKLLTSEGQAGIRKDGADLGLVSFFLSQEDVEANIPIGSWQQFLRLTWNDEILGEVSKHLWLGTIHVSPARDTA